MSTPSTTPRTETSWPTHGSRWVLSAIALGVVLGVAIPWLGATLAPASEHPMPMTHETGGVHPTPGGDAGHARAEARRGLARQELERRLTRRIQAVGGNGIAIDEVRFDAAGTTVTVSGRAVSQPAVTVAKSLLGAPRRFPELTADPANWRLHPTVCAISAGAETTTGAASGGETLACRWGWSATLTPGR